MCKIIVSRIAMELVVDGNFALLAGNSGALYIINIGVNSFLGYLFKKMKKKIENICRKENNAYLCNRK